MVDYSSTSRDRKTSQAGYQTLLSTLDIGIGPWINVEADQDSKSESRDVDSRVNLSKVTYKGSLNKGARCQSMNLDHSTVLVILPSMASIELTIQEMSILTIIISMITMVDSIVVKFNLFQPRKVMPVKFNAINKLN